MALDYSYFDVAAPTEFTSKLLAYFDRSNSFYQLLGYWLEAHIEPKESAGSLIDHSLKVACIARYLAEQLSARGIEVDVELVEQAAWFHDLWKVEINGSGLDFNTHPQHAQDFFAKAADQSECDDLRKLGTIIGRHENIEEFAGAETPWEELVMETVVLIIADTLAARTHDNGYRLVRTLEAFEADARRRYSEVAASAD